MMATFHAFRLLTKRDTSRAVPDVATGARYAEMYLRAHGYTEEVIRRIEAGDRITYRGFSYWVDSEEGER